MRVLCKDCKYYEIENWEEMPNELKEARQQYLCTHPDTVHPVNGQYNECCDIRIKGECGIEGDLFTPRNIND